MYKFILAFLVALFVTACGETTTGNSPSDTGQPTELAPKTTAMPTGALEGTPPGWEVYCIEHKKEEGDQC